MKEKTKVVVKELKITAYHIIHVLWALSRVQVKKSLEIIMEFSIDDEPINFLIMNILSRVNPDYGYQIKIVAKEYCDEFHHMFLKFPIIHKTLHTKDEI